MTPTDQARRFCEAFAANGHMDRITLFADETFSTMPEPERRVLVKTFAAMGETGKSYTETCQEVMR